MEKEEEVRREVAKEEIREIWRREKTQCVTADFKNGGVGMKRNTGELKELKKVPFWQSAIKWEPSPCNDKDMNSSNNLKSSVVDTTPKPPGKTLDETSWIWLCEALGRASQTRLLTYKIMK